LTNKIKVRYYKIRLYNLKYILLNIPSDLKSSIIDYKLIFALILKLICVPRDLKSSITNSKLIFTLIYICTDICIQND
jgi:hypothetical protein